MPAYFADLHCHPTLYGFNRARNAPAEDDPEQFNAWATPASNLDHWRKGLRARTYAQCDAPKLVQGRVRLAFASITPIEAGFFGHIEGQQTTWVQEALELASGVSTAKALAAWRSSGARDALQSLAGVIRTPGPLRELIQTKFMGYSPARVRHMASDRYDYWQEYLAEYRYLTTTDAQHHHKAIETPSGPVQVSGAYHLARSLDHLTSILDDHDANQVAVVLSIEGAHAFTIGPDQKRLPLDVIHDRIEQLKHQPHPVVLLTLAHHFDNGLCGHAHSIPDAAKLVIDQSPRMHEGFERTDDIGLSVVRHLLSLDASLRDTGEPRIHIDCKHMSPLTRREYYDEVVFPVAQRAKEGHNRPIPVVFSHAAYSGQPTLDALITNAAHETDHWRLGAFNAWGINLCDEDIRAVHATDGLIGLVFEQRILGLKHADKTPHQLLARVVLRHILAIVDVIMLDDRIPSEAKPSIWSTICLGTDYDGMIDPLAPYPTALDLDTFADDLRDQLVQIAHTRHIEAIGVEELVEDICWRNTSRWLRRHWT